MRLLFTLIILYTTTCSSLAQQGLRYDSSAIRTRNFNAQKINAYAAEKDFQYNLYAEPPKSLWERFWDWFWARIEDLLNTSGGAAVFKTGLITVAVLILAFFVYKLSGMGKAGLFKRNTGDVSGYAIADEDIHSIPFAEAIEQAVKDGNYRLAVRLLYLQSLKNMADKNLINWQLNKTNIAYLQELQGRSYQPAFSNLTLQFESNWYGDMPIDAVAFSQVREAFNQFNQSVK